MIIFGEERFSAVKVKRKQGGKNEQKGANRRMPLPKISCEGKT
jgi:hypothetical protein